MPKMRRLENLRWISYFPIGQVGGLGHYRPLDPVQALIATVSTHRRLDTIRISMI